MNGLKDIPLTPSKTKADERLRAFISAQQSGDFTIKRLLEIATIILMIKQH